MELVVTNPNFRAKPVLKAISKPGGGVDHHRCGINLPKKAHGLCMVFRYDGIGVLRTISRDMRHSGIDISHKPNRDNRRQVLGMPVILGRVSKCDRLMVRQALDELTCLWADP